MSTPEDGGVPAGEPHTDVVVAAGGGSALSFQEERLVESVGIGIETTDRFSVDDIDDYKPAVEFDDISQVSEVSSVGQRTLYKQFDEQPGWRKWLELLGLIATIASVPLGIYFGGGGKTPTAATTIPTTISTTTTMTPMTPSAVFTQVKCGYSLRLDIGAQDDFQVKEASCGAAVVPNDASSRGRWNSFVAPEGGAVVTASTCSEKSALFPYDTRIRVYEKVGDSGEARVCVNGTDDDGDGCGADSRLSTVQFRAEDGVTYLLLVDGTDSAGGTTFLSVLCRSEFAGEANIATTSTTSATTIAERTDAPTTRPSMLPSSSPTSTTTTTAMTSTTTTSTSMTTTSTSTKSSTSTAKGDTLKAQICDALPSTCDDLSTEGTPQFKALEWVVNNSNYESYAVWRRMQRYTLAAVAFSLEGWGLNGIVDWRDGGEDECSWMWGPIDPLDKILCDSSGRVTDIAFDDNLVAKGKVPVDVALLSDSLGRLWFCCVEFSGLIPTELGMLSELSLLTLDENELAGPIPTEFGRLTNLDILFLYDNRLSGLIPTELGLLSNLGTLFLNDNKLSGTIPTELGLLSNLGIIYLNGNKLSGMIPTELGLLSNLDYLSLRQNNLIGSMPAEVCNLRIPEGQIVGLDADCKEEVQCNNTVCCTDCY